MPNPTRGLGPGQLLDPFTADPVHHRAGHRCRIGVRQRTVLQHEGAKPAAAPPRHRPGRLIPTEYILADDIVGEVGLDFLELIGAARKIRLSRACPSSSAATRYSSRARACGSRRAPWPLRRR